MLNILLTGASGFVGQAMLRQLASHNVSITAICREHARQTLPEQGNLHNVVITDSIFNKDTDWWKEKLQGIDVVIHTAWYVNPADYLHSDENIICLTGTLTLAQACIQSRVRYFAGTGTCFEYDHSADYLTVDTPLNPRSLYASGKASTFSLLTHLFAKTTVGFGWYRLFYLYGRNEHPSRLVPFLIDKFKKNEKAKLNQSNLVRDYLDVDVAAKKIVDNVLLLCPGTFNVCSGEELRIKDLALQIADTFNARHLLDMGEIPPSASTPLKIVGVCNLAGKNHEN